ncbi:hypothetical protein D9M68_822520 [compost metagenome]
MAVGQRAYLVHLQQQLHPRACRRRIVLGQAQVVALGRQPFLQEGRLLRLDGQAHAGMPLVEQAERVGQDRMGKSGQGDDRQLAALERPQARRGGRHPLEAGIGLADLVE